MTKHPFTCRRAFFSSFFLFSSARIWALFHANSLMSSSLKGHWEGSPGSLGPLTFPPAFLSSFFFLRWCSCYGSKNTKDTEIRWEMERDSVCGVQSVDEPKVLQGIHEACVSLSSCSMMLHAHAPAPCVQKVTSTLLLCAWCYNSCPPHLDFFYDLVLLLQRPACASPRHWCLDMLPLDILPFMGMPYCTVLLPMTPHGIVCEMLWPHARRMPRRHSMHACNAVQLHSS